MNIKKQVLTFKARRFKKSVAAEALLFYSRFSSSIPHIDPDFLGIGPTRSATDWLFKRLSLHPNIFIPSAKGVNFFDKKSEDDSRYSFDLSDPIHWKWYHYHFKDGVSKVKGEISPSYSILNEERIKEISSHLPNIKLIYSIRNPIDRAWSSLRFRLWYGKGITASKISVDELIPESVT